MDEAESCLDELKEMFGCLLMPCASTRQSSSTYNKNGQKVAAKPLKPKQKRKATKAVDENLNKIRNNVSALRNMVLEMDTETDGKHEWLHLAFISFVSEQNEMLERINKKAKENERRVQITSDNAKQILESEKPCNLM